VKEQLSFTSLLIVVFLAFVVPLILLRFKRLRLPIVVGEILAGIIVGRSGLQLVAQNDPLLELLGELGFVFLMFLSGMEIDFSSLGPLQRGSANRSSRWGPVSIALLSFVITLALSSAIGFGLFALQLVRNPWMMALILSTTSLGVVVPVLKETGLSSGRFGQTLLVAALIADFATMLLITILVAVLSHGLTFDLLLIGVLFLAFFLLYRFGMIFNRVKAVRHALEELSHAAAQIKVRAAFAIMLILIVLSEALGTEIILGAFLAGAIVSLLRTPDDAGLSHQLDAIGFGFLIPIFFIKVGVDFNLAVLLASSQAMLLVPLLLAAAIVVKLIAGQVFRLNFSRREALAAGSLLSARLSLIIAASAIGLRLGVISEQVNAAIILVAIITVAGAPLLFTRLIPDRAEHEPRPMLVVGAGQLGLQVAAQLVAHQEPVVVVDADEARVARARQLGYEARQGDLDQSDPALAALLDRAHTLVCTYADLEVAYRVCCAARGTYGIDHVVAQVDSPNDLGRFEQLGVTTMNAAIDRAALLVMLARNPATYELLTRTDDNKEVSEVVVERSQYVGRTLRQLSLPGDVLVLALRRQGDSLVPHGSTRLELGDRLTLVGSLGYVDNARRMFGEEFAGID
jgi:CPA2 family monovalent cation:H+ antiporter-2